MIGRLVVGLVVLVGLGAASDGVAGQDPAFPSARPLPPCDSPEVDPWVKEARDRMMDSDLLLHYAVELFGHPGSCAGLVDSEFAGMKFGTLRFGFVRGVTFQLETMPPEISIVTLRSPEGFPDGDSARQALKSYTAGIGLEIDWTTAESSAEGEERVTVYWDPDPGLNAQAAYIFSGETLVALRFSIAL